MKITVCIGSSCHMKGSRQVVEQLQQLLAERGLADQIELAGSVCMDRCQDGVCVTVEEQFYSVTPNTVKEFFETSVMPKV